MLTTQFFAMKIQRYMADHGISESTLARVASKAFENGSRNPNAWRRKPLTEAEVRTSRMVNHPLTQYMFCSPGEGAVALVLATARAGEAVAAQAGVPAVGGVPDAALRLLRGLQPVDPDHVGAVSDDRGGGGRVRAGRASGRTEVDIAQLQDTESGAEVMHLAETGLCEHGEQEGIISAARRGSTGACP